ncbi:MAG: redox-sensing transcriptional repressor Rex [Rikenellaceae bacterium]
MELPSELPERTIERLSEYRRTLLRNLENGITHVYSHVLASIHGITAVQVRRDLMLIGFSSNTKKGYDVRELVDFISSILDSTQPLNVAVVGMGNLGRAVTKYFKDKRAKLRIVVSLDNNPEKVGAIIVGVPCCNIEEIDEVIKEKNISILLLTLPAVAVDDLINKIKKSKVKGIVNFTGTPLTALEGSGIWVEDYDIITILEKVAYYTKHQTELS